MEHLTLQTLIQKLTLCHQLLTSPIKTIKTKPIISEPSRRIKNRIMSQFQKYKIYLLIAITITIATTISTSHFIWMILSRKPSKSRLDRLVICKRRHAQHSVKVALALDFIKSFKDCIQKVTNYHHNEDVSSMSIVPRRRRLRMWITRTYGDFVIYILNYRGSIL